MVLVEGGTFQMGSESGYQNERPVHPVTLSSFYIERYEVTYEKWTEVRTWAGYHGYTGLKVGQNGNDTSGFSFNLDMASGARVQPWGMIQRSTQIRDWQSENYVNSAMYKGNLRHSILGLRMRGIIIFGPAFYSNGYNLESKKNPVTMVGWHDVIQWCNARSEMEGLTPVYYEYADRRTVIRKGYRIPTPDAADWNANGYRLPTDAEWEFAARGGVHSHNYQYSGNDVIGDVAWYSDNSGGTTHPVGMKQGNELGLFDMTGNVEECVQDSPEGPYPNSAQVNPRYGLHLTGTRGGSCIEQPFKSRNTYRGWDGGSYPWQGFRCVRAALH